MGKSLSVGARRRDLAHVTDRIGGSDPTGSLQRPEGGAPKRRASAKGTGWGRFATQGQLQQLHGDDVAQLGHCGLGELLGSAEHIRASVARQVLHF